MDDLKLIRLDRGHNVMSLAKATELHHLTIANVESGKTLPQKQVRKRIEMCLGTRVNWMATSRFKGAVASIDWEDIESELRRALANVSVLPRSQQNAFLRLASEYIATLKKLLREQKHNPDYNITLPEDIENQVKIRKSKYSLINVNR